MNFVTSRYVISWKFVEYLEFSIQHFNNFSMKIYFRLIFFVWKIFDTFHSFCLCSWILKYQKHFEIRIWDSKRSATEGRRIPENKHNQSKTSYLHFYCPQLVSLVSSQVDTLWSGDLLNLSFLADVSPTRFWVDFRFIFLWKKKKKWSFRLN